MTETPIVFLPGFLCDERMWAHQVKVFSAQAPCMVVDLRMKATLHDMVEALRAVPFAKFNLVGFSMGAYVAQAFAIQSADRINELVLIGATGDKLGDKEYNARVKMKSLLKNTAYAGMSDAELKYFLYPYAYDVPEIRDLVRDMAASNTSEMYLNQMLSTLDRQDFKARLAALHFPITLIGGALDKLAPRTQVEEFHRAVPRSRLEILEGCGHFVPLEKPAELDHILLSIL